LVKEHKVTGLKYLCKHEAQSLKDCVLYRGSGTYWKRHLKHLSEHIKIIQPLAAKAAKEKLTGVKKSEQHRYNMCGERPHVNQTGSKNNNAKKIQTPFGIFYSISEASKNIQGYTYKMIWSRLNNVSGWRYI